MPASALWDSNLVLRDNRNAQAPAVIRIHCKSETVDTLGGPWEGHEKWEGGVVGDDGCLYAMPQQALKVLKIQPAAGPAAHSEA